MQAKESVLHIPALYFVHVSFKTKHVHEMLPRTSSSFWEMCIESSDKVSCSSHLRTAVSKLAGMVQILLFPSESQPTLVLLNAGNLAKV